MNTVPPQIQATSNLGPSAPHPDWPLLSLTITALLILVLAIGLVTISPSGLVTYPLSFRWYHLGCQLCSTPRVLFPLHCLTNRTMTPLFLILAVLPSLLASPCPCSDIYSYVHSSCYNTAPRPCTMNLGERGKSKPLLTVKVQKRGSFMSTCHKPNGKKYVSIPLPTGGTQMGVGYQIKIRKKVIKNLISQLQATPEPYKHLDLLSQLRPLMKPPSDNQHLTCLLNSSNSSSTRNTHPSVGYACHSLLHHTQQFPYPQHGCHRTTIPSLPNKKPHNLLGQCLTMSYSQPLQTQPVSTTLVPTTLVLTNSAPSSCSTWVLWNSTNNCTNLGIFILFGTYAYSCLPLDPPGP